ncbi:MULTISPECIES: hypothetical protein [unclassified Agrobacterium]
MHKDEIEKSVDEMLAGWFNGERHDVDRNDIIELVMKHSAVDAEPVATVAVMGASGVRVLVPHPPGSVDHLPIGAKLYSAPPAPSVAVKALEWKAHNEGFGHGRMHYGTGAFGHWYGVSRVKTGCWGCVHHIDGKAVHLPMAKSLEAAKAAAQADYEARIRSALSAQVQDVAEPDFFYRIEYDYRSYVEKKTMWGLYRELGVVALEEAQEALRTAQQNNAGNFRISRKPAVKWEPLPAAPAKQDKPD